MSLFIFINIWYFQLLLQIVNINRSFAHFPCNQFHDFPFQSKFETVQVVLEIDNDKEREREKKKRFVNLVNVMRCQRWFVHIGSGECTVVAMKRMSKWAKNLNWNELSYRRNVHEFCFVEHFIQRVFGKQLHINREFRYVRKKNKRFRIIENTLTIYSPLHIYPFPSLSTLFRMLVAILVYVTLIVRYE